MPKQAEMISYAFELELSEPETNMFDPVGPGSESAAACERELRLRVALGRARIAAAKANARGDD